MDSKISLLLSFFFLICNAKAFNITKILGQYPDFSTFNSYLTQTNLANTINSRQSITVLVVDNDNIAPLSKKPANILKRIMSVHVVLDYFDVKKLQNLENKTATLTTLHQSSGEANGQDGLLNVTDLDTGSVVFRSAAKGVVLGANLVKSISSQPYNISILQISTVIIPLGIENEKSNTTSPSSSPAMSPTPMMLVPVPAPSPSPPMMLVPVPAPAPSPPMMLVPAPAPTPSPPMMLVPVPAPAPTRPMMLVPAPAPANSPPESPADAPSNTPDSATAPAPADDEDSSSGLRSELRFSVSLLAIVVCLLLAA